MRKRLGCLVLCFILCFCPFFSNVDLMVYADGEATSTSTQGTGSSGSTTVIRGNGEGQRSDKSTKNTICCALTLWSKDGDHWKLLSGMLQSLNTRGSFYNSNTFFDNNVFPMDVIGGVNYLSAYLNHICASGNTVTDVPWGVYRRNQFVTTKTSLSEFRTVAPVNASWWKAGSTFGYFDTGQTLNFTDAECYAQTMSLLATDSDGRVPEILKELGDLAGVSNVSLRSGEYKLGVSECLVSFQKADTRKCVVTGIMFDDTFNSMKVAETQTILFNAGQQAVFTYVSPDAPEDREDIIHTYDVDHNPSTPAKSEVPDCPEQEGIYTINKVYVDMNGGSDSHTFKTTQTCKNVVVSDEYGKIPSEWSFQGWKTSAENASGYSHTDYSGFSSGLQHGLGVYDMSTAPSGNKQINLLFVKQFTPAAGALIITEQSLGLGTTGTYAFYYLSGTDTIGQHQHDLGVCGHYREWYGPERDAENKPVHHEETCSDHLKQWFGLDYSRTFWYQPAPMFTLFEPVDPILGAATSGTPGVYSGTGYVAGATNDSWWSFANVSESSDPPGHSNHEPDRKASVAAVNNATLQATNLAIYRYTGLHDIVKPMFGNAAFTWVDNGDKYALNRVTDPGYAQITSMYYSSVGTYTSRHTAGSGWTQLGSGTTGSLAYQVDIPKDGSGRYSDTTELSCSKDGSAVSAGDTSGTSLDATLITTGTTPDGDALLDNIIVYTYRAHDMTAAEYGDRLEYDVTFKPMVVMHVPYAQSDAYHAADSVANSSTNHANDKSANVLVEGEKTRRLRLSSKQRVTWQSDAGMGVQPNTILNDARVMTYLTDTHSPNLGWSALAAPVPIPAGSVLNAGQRSVAESSANQTPYYGTIKIDTTTPLITDNSPFYYQATNNCEDWLIQDNTNWNELANMGRNIWIAKAWQQRYEGIGVGDVSGRQSTTSLNSYINSCVDKLEKTYIALYVSDKVDQDAYDFFDMKLFKTKNGNTPTGIIQSGGKFTDLNNGGVRMAHDDVKYSFGGIDNHSYFRIVREPYPLTSFSLIGMDTAGGAYAVSSSEYGWELPLDVIPLDMDVRNFYGQEIIALLAPASNEDLIGQIKSLDYDSDPAALRGAYVLGCGLAVAELGYSYWKPAISESYITQTPFVERYAAKGGNWTYYYKDGQLQLGSRQAVDFSLASRLKQLADSVEHDAGHDNTWYADGDWYNEGVLPFFDVYTRDQIHLLFPTDSSTVVDTALMGDSSGKDDMYGADDIYWNGAVVGIAYDGMTQAQFEDGIRMTLPSWGSATPSVELYDLGVSQPLAISNTDVSDLY